MFHGKIIFRNPRHPGLRSLCVDDFIYGHVLDRTLLKNANYTSHSILPSVFFHFQKKNFSVYMSWTGLLRWVLVVKNTCQCRGHKRCGFYPWVRKIPWRRAWQPTPVFLPEESHGQRSLVGYSDKSQT